MRIFLLLLIYFITCCASLFAQSFPLEKIDDKYGLNRKEIFRTLIDKKGYLWVTASPGVFRFNGDQFDEIGRETSLSFTTCYNITEDEKGVIWLLNDKFEIYKFENEQVTWVNRLEKDKFQSFNVISFGCRNDSLILVDFEREIKLCCKTGRKNKRFFDTDKYDYSIDLSDPNYTHVLGAKSFNKSLVNGGVGRGITIRFITPDVDSLVTLSKVRDLYSRLNSVPSLKFQDLKNGNIVIYLHNLLYLISEDLVIKTLSIPEDVAITNVFQDSEKRLWVSSYYNKLYCYDKELNPINFDLSEFNGDMVTSIIEDDFGGYWFATYLKGLKYCSNLNFNRCNFKEEKSDFIPSNFCKVTENKLYIGSNSGGIYELDSLRRINFFIKHKDSYKTKYIKTLYYDTLYDELWCGLKHGLSKISPTDKTIWYSQGIDRVYAREIYRESDSILILAANTRLMRINLNQNLKSQVQEVDKITYHYCLERMGAFDYWVGTNYGIQKYNSSTLEKSVVKVKNTGGKVSNILRIDSTTWVVSDEYGLVAIDGDSTVKYGKNYGITDSRINCLHNMGDSILWVGGEASLYAINLRDSPRKVVKYDHTFGMPKGEVRDISSTGNILWLNIGKALWNVDYTTFKKNLTISQTHIQNVIGLDSIYCYPKKISTPYNQKLNLEVQFRNLNFPRKDNLQFRYRVLGFNDKWIKTNNINTILPTLIPGDYVFELQSLSYANLWNPTEELKISITPLFWQTLWFKGAVMILMGVGLFYFIYWRIEKVKLNEAKNTQLAQLELKALKAQMNPHFIFNSIASVQYYLTKNNSEKATEYLQNFSSLIRKVLEHSDSNLVSLSSELKVIENYIALESKKFKDDDLKLKLILDDSIDMDAMQVPPTLIQPYVENSIWHGLKTKKGPKWITIQVSNDNKKIFITIEDNGIGRLAAKKNQKKGRRKSFGMTITSNRIQVLNGNSKNNLYIEDLYTDNIPTGTKVYLEFPFVKTTNGKKD